jgi:ribose/xylose/arabinose/galactoside ABC-type transport system permease subunit
MTNTVQPRFPTLRRERFTTMVGGTPTVLLGVGIVLVVAVMTVAVPTFASGATARTVMLSTTWIGILAIGTTMALAAGAIDFSIAAIVAFSGIVTAAVAAEVGGVLGSVAGILAGAAFGLINAVLVVRLRLNPFLATLASGTALRGFCYLLSETANTGITINDEFLLQTLGASFERSVPYVFLLLVAITLVATWVMSESAFGRSLIAVGGNPSAARLVGIRPERSKVVAYVLSGAFAGVAGVLLASRIGSGLPAAALGQELTLFSAVLLGGTALWGGRSNVVGSVAAVLFMSVLYTGIVLAGLPNRIPGLVSSMLLVFSIWITQRQTLHTRTVPTGSDEASTVEGGP